MNPEIFPGVQTGRMAAPNRLEKLPERMYAASHAKDNDYDRGHPYVVEPTGACHGV